MMRYPHALTSCASAIESIIKASPSCKTRSRGLNALLEAAQNQVDFIKNAPQLELKHFRDTRNRIIHEGFSLKDNSESTSLMIQVGFPLASACLKDLHSFDLADSLLQEYTEQLSIATKVYQRAYSTSNDLTYCLKGLGHLIRWSLRGNFSAYWAEEALNDAEQSGQKFDIIHPEKGKIERQFGAYWDFDCPVCDNVETAVAELSESGLEAAQIRPVRLACTNCGFTVSKSDLFLAEVLLERQIATASQQILKEYGIHS